MRRIVLALGFLGAAFLGVVSYPQDVSASHGRWNTLYTQCTDLCHTSNCDCYNG